MCRGSNFWVDFIAGVEVELMLILKRLMVAFLGVWKLKSQQEQQVRHTQTHTHTQVYCVYKVFGFKRFAPESSSKTAREETAKEVKPEGLRVAKPCHKRDDKK